MFLPIIYEMISSRFGTILFIFLVLVFVFVSPLSAQKAPAPGELATAVSTGDMSRIDTLLVRGANPDQPDSNGQTALLYAVSSGNFELIQKILDTNADPDKVGADNLTPLMRAVMMSREDLVILLLSRDADRNKITDHSPLGAVSALSMAIDRGEQDMAHLLFQEGATPLLLANPEPGSANPLKLPKLRTPLDGRIWWKTAVVKDRAYSPDWDASAAAGNDEWTLHRAARDNQWRLVREEEDKGFPIDLQDVAGVTALMTASWHGNDSIVSLLLQRDADPLRSDSSGIDALVYAAAGGNAGTVSRLLDSIDLDFYNDKIVSRGLETSPYYYAVSGRQHQVLDLLLDAGISTVGIDEEGVDLLMMASWLGDAYAVGRLLPLFNGAIDKAGRSALDWSLAAFNRDRTTGRELGDPERGALNYPVTRLLAGRLRNPLLYSTQPAADTHQDVIASWSPGMTAAKVDDWRNLQPSPVPAIPGDGDLTLHRILRDEEPG